MSVPTSNYDLAGNNLVSSGSQISFDSMTNVDIPVANRPYQLAGTGAPTFAAPKGSTFIRLDGSSTSTRMYINTNGSTTWTSFTSAA